MHGPLAVCVAARTYFKKKNAKLFGLLKNIVLSLCETLEVAPVSGYFSRALSIVKFNLTFNVVFQSITFLYSKDYFNECSRRLSSLYVSRCIDYIERVHNLPLDTFCEFAGLNLNGLRRIAAGKHTPHFAYLLRLQYLLEFLYTNSASKEPFPEIREML